MVNFMGCELRPLDLPPAIVSEGEHLREVCCSECHESEWRIVLSCINGNMLMTCTSCGEQYILERNARE